jgi:hypothetical protein
MIINFCIWVLQKRITNVALEKPLTLPTRGLLKAIHNLLEYFQAKWARFAVRKWLWARSRLPRALEPPPCSTSATRS